MSIWDWDSTAANNASGAPSINWAEGQAPSTVNDSARQMMADVAAWRDILFTTGDVKLTLKTTADSGWVMMDDGTIGDASSSATTRANADTEDLFTLLWTNTADADCAVSTGRGASAAADFAAHKTIALPKALGRALACYGAGSGLTSRNLAHVVGEETHTLTGAESGLVSHSHAKGTLAGSFPIDTSGGSAGTALAGPLTTIGHNDTTFATTITGSTATAAAADASNAHNNMQPTVFLNVMIKL